MLSNNQNTTNQPFNHQQKTDDRKINRIQAQNTKQIWITTKLVEEHKPNNQDTLHKDNISVTTETNKE